MNLKLSPNKTEGSNCQEVTSTETLTKIQQSAPAWFANTFSYSSKVFNSFNREIQFINMVKAELKTDVLNLENKIVELEESKNNQSETIRKLEEKIDHHENHLR